MNISYNCLSHNTSTAKKKMNIGLPVDQLFIWEVDYYRYVLRSAYVTAVVLSQKATSCDCRSMSFRHLPPIRPHMRTPAVPKLCAPVTAASWLTHRLHLIASSAAKIFEIANPRITFGLFALNLSVRPWLARLIRAVCFVECAACCCSFAWMAVRAH